MIARTTIPLAQHLGLDVIVEGVETLEQADLLRELQCKYARGFLFSRPINAGELSRLLARTLAAGVDAPNPVSRPVLAWPSLAKDGRDTPSPRARVGLGRN